MRNLFIEWFSVLFIVAHLCVWAAAALRQVTANANTLTCFCDLSHECKGILPGYIPTHLFTYLCAAASGRSNDERCGSCAGNPPFFPLTLVSRSRGVYLLVTFSPPPPACLPRATWTLRGYHLVSKSTKLCPGSAAVVLRSRSYKAVADMPR